MSRPKQPFDESLAQTIYRELLRFATKEDTIPNMSSFHRYMTNAPDDPRNPGLGYGITWGEFRYHWNELLIRQHIKIEQVTGALKIDKVNISVEDD